MFFPIEKDTLIESTIIASMPFLSMSSGCTIKYSSMFFALSRSHVLALSLLIGFAPVVGTVHAKNFIGYTGKRWVSDYGVLHGECNVKELSKTLKKGSSVSETAQLEIDQTAIALLAGTRSESANQLDSACFGHTLELVPSGQAVRWLNTSSGVGVYLSPGAKSDTCRTYLGVVAVSGQKTKFRGEACSPSPGVWRLQP